MAMERDRSRVRGKTVVIRKNGFSVAAKVLGTKDNHSRVNKRDRSKKKNIKLELLP
jgi:hypothetical protein